MVLQFKSRRRCRCCGGCGDCLPTILLQDADEYYHARTKNKADLIRRFGGQGWIRHVRAFYVLIPILLLASWVAYNIWAASLADDAALAVRGSLAEVWAEKNVLRLRSFQYESTSHRRTRKNSRGIFCSCTFTDTSSTGGTGTVLIEPPYAQLELNPDFKSMPEGGVSVVDILDMCPHTCSLDIKQKTNDTLPVLRALNKALKVFMRTVEDARITVPPSTVMLENGTSWDAAQLSVAHGAFVTGSNRAKEVLADAQSSNITGTHTITAQEVQHAACHVDRLYASLLLMSTMLFNLPLSSKQLAVYNGSSDSLAVIDCVNLPKTAQELPMKLTRFCSRPSGIAQGFNVTEGLGTINCTDPYHAYQQWCNPQYCIEMREKHAWDRATESLAALGGLWCFLTAFLFTFTWHAIYESYKRWSAWKQSRASAGSFGSSPARAGAFGSSPAHAGAFGGSPSGAGVYGGSHAPAGANTVFGGSPALATPDRQE